jgi:hypothetical protein
MKNEKKKKSKTEKNEKIEILKSRKISRLLSKFGRNLRLFEE